MSKTQQKSKPEPLKANRYTPELAEELPRCKLASLMRDYPIDRAVWDTSKPEIVHYEWRKAKLTIRDAAEDGSVQVITGTNCADDIYNLILDAIEQKHGRLTASDAKKYLFTKKAAREAKAEQAEEAKTEEKPRGKLSLRKRAYTVKNFGNWMHFHTIADLADVLLNHLHEQKAEIEDAEVFVFNGVLCEARQSGVDLRRMPLDDSTLSKHINEVAHFSVKTEDAKFWKTTAPPAAVIDLMLASDAPDEWAAPLERIASAPFFTASGELVTKPGYNRSAAAVYQPPRGGLELPDIPKRPTPDQVAEAVAAIDDIICDFPRNDKDGKNTASRAHMFAMLLHLFMRDLVQGSAPIYAIPKQLPGDGASKFMDIVSLVALGRLCSTSPLPKQTEGEWDKFLLTVGVEAKEIVSIDNVPIGHKVASDAFASVITSGTVTGRLLTVNRTATVHLRGLIAVNGNQLAMSDELCRRALVVRFDTETPDPTIRAEPFKHPELEAYVKANRGRIVAACLTLIQNWVAQGKPLWKGEPLVSFEEYCRVMGGILDAAGVPDFLANRHLARGEDGRDYAMNALVTAWDRQFGEAAVYVGAEPNIADVPDLLSLLCLHKEIRFWFQDNYERSSWNKALGHQLSRNVGATFDTGSRWVQIEKHQTKHGTQYKLREIPKPKASAADSRTQDADRVQ